MPRFYVPHPQIEKGLLRVEGDEVRHIRRVLRLKTGDEATIFDGSAREYKGKIVEEGPSSVVILIQDILPSKSESFLEITLAQGLLKGEKMDYVIQKATELGIEEIVPFVSSRSIPQLDKEKKIKRHQRWEKIAIEASKQCGRGVVPKIGALRDYPGILQIASSDSVRLALWEREGRRLKEVLEGLGEKRKIFFIVGPEGGLSQEEAGQAVEKGFITISLGKRILRSETASLCLLSILQYERGDIG